MYIPTTEEVREQFACMGRAIEVATDLRGGSNFRKTDEEWLKYFDRWLRNERAKIWAEGVGWFIGGPHGEEVYKEMLKHNPYLDLDS